MGSRRPTARTLALVALGLASLVVLVEAGLGWLDDDGGSGPRRTRGFGCEGWGAPGDPVGAMGAPGGGSGPVRVPAAKSGPRSSGDDSTVDPIGGGKPTIGNAVDPAGAVVPAVLVRAGEVRFSAEGHAYNPVFSKDGKWLAYEVNGADNGSIELFVSSVTGAIAKDGVKVALAGGRRDGASDQVLINATWHPGGLALIEGSHDGGDYRLYIYTPGGGAPTELLSTRKAPGSLTFPAVAPDGNVVAFVSSATGRGDIRSWDRTTDTMHQWTTTPETEAFPTYSPDSKRLVFDRHVGDGEDLYALDLATKTETPFATGPGDQTRPVFTGRGRVLYFTNARGADVWDIVSVDDAGRDEVILAKDVRLPLRARPAVTPDGQWVAWAPNRAELSGKVYLTRIDGSAIAGYQSPHDACGEPALTVSAGRTILAYTFLEDSGADWRHLGLADVTDILPN